MIHLPLILDGATGTALQKRGMPAGACTEQWVLEHPEAIWDVQARYLDAGSDVLYAPTFGANPVKLHQHHIDGQTADYNRRLLELTQQAGATAVGCAVAIEKGFQHGGDRLRERGIRVDSLAILERMEPEIVFRSL